MTQQLFFLAGLTANLHNELLRGEGTGVQSKLSTRGVPLSITMLCLEVFNDREITFRAPFPLTPCCLRVPALTQWVIPVVVAFGRQGCGRRPPHPEIPGTPRASTLLRTTRESKMRTWSPGHARCNGHCGGCASHGGGASSALAAANRGAASGVSPG